MTRRHDWRPALVTLITLISLTACDPGPSASSSSVVVGTITPDGTDRYLFDQRGSGLTVQAPAANVGGNLRVVVVDSEAPVLVDQQACVTWDGPMGAMIQPGITLRTKIEGDHTRALLVTNNIFRGYRHGFNVSVVDSDGLEEAGTGSDPPGLTKIAGFDMTAGVGNIVEIKPLPWRLCARVVGPTLSVKAWSVSSFDREPSWSDPRFGGSVTLPESLVYAGSPGIYVGHLKAGEHTRFGPLAATAVDPNGPVVTVAAPGPEVAAAVPAIPVSAMVTHWCGAG